MKTSINMAKRRKLKNLAKLRMKMKIPKKTMTKRMLMEKKIQKNRLKRTMII